MAAATIADDMALDAYVNSLTDLERVSFERAATARYAHKGYDSYDLTRNYDKGFADGQRAAKRIAEQSAKDGKPNTV